MFPDLMYPLPNLKLKTIENSEKRFLVWDIVRRHYVVLTPEEWVRQHCIHYLIEQNHYPKNKIAVELRIRIGGLNKRCDIVVFDGSMKPFLLVECKSPYVPLSQETLNQAARYNLSLDVPNFLISNGLNHFCCRINHTEQRFDLLENLPLWA